MYYYIITEGHYKRYYLSVSVSKRTNFSFHTKGCSMEIHKVIKTSREQNRAWERSAKRILTSLSQELEQTAEVNYRGKLPFLHS